jgi:hypothetical protein
MIAAPSSAAAQTTGNTEKRPEIDDSSSEFVCKGMDDAGCSSNYSTNNQSNLNRHKKTCGRTCGGKRAGSGRPPVQIAAPSSAAAQTTGNTEKRPEIDDSSSENINAGLIRNIEEYFANQNMKRHTCACCKSCLRHPR